MGPPGGMKPSRRRWKSTTRCLGTSNPPKIPGSRKRKPSVGEEIKGGQTKTLDRDGGVQSVDQTPKRKQTLLSNWVVRRENNNSPNRLRKTSISPQTMSKVQVGVNGIITAKTVSESPVKSPDISSGVTLPGNPALISIIDAISNPISCIQDPQPQAPGRRKLDENCPQQGVWICTKST